MCSRVMPLPVSTTSTSTLPLCAAVRTSSIPPDGHGVARIQKQIQEDLLQFVGGTAHRRNAFRQLLDHLNLRSLQRMRHEREGFFDDAIQVDVGEFPGSGARKVQKIIDDFAGAKRLLDDFVDDGVARITVRHLLRQHLDVVGDDGQRRVDFMRDARGQQSKGRQLLGLGQLFFHAVALGDVVEQQQAPDAFGRLADQRSDGNVDDHGLALVFQAVFVNSGDLLLVAARGNFLNEFRRKQFAQRAAHGVVASHAKQLLHAGVPGFDGAFQVDGQHADVQRFHDVFAEVLEASDFEGFLLERAVKLGIVECDGNVARDGLHQFNVVAGKKIAVYGLAKPENGNGVLANAAGNEIIEIELFEGAANGFADVSGGARRLKEKRSTRKFLASRRDETEIQRLARRTPMERARRISPGFC